MVGGGALEWGQAMGEEDRAEPAHDMGSWVLPAEALGVRAAGGNFKRKDLL